METPGEDSQAFNLTLDVEKGIRGDFKGSTPSQHKVDNYFLVSFPKDNVPLVR